MDTKLLKKIIFLTFCFLFLPFCALASSFYHPEKNPNPIPCCTNNNSNNPQALIKKLRAEGVEVIQIGDQLKIILGVDRFFERNSNTVLRTSQGNTLNDVAALLRTRGDVPIIISGHTDNVGSDRSKLYRSRKQAETIRAYLWSHFIPLWTMHVIGCGDTEPVAGNKTIDGSTANRRIEIETEEPYARRGREK